ncbi:hypothetical protein CR513_37697, partial [Mucuna pruriens]
MNPIISVKIALAKASDATASHHRPPVQFIPFPQEVYCKMASLKAEKPVGSQSSGQVKKEPAKPSGSTPKDPASKPAPKKTEKRSRPKKKKYRQAAVNEKISQWNDD